VRNPYMTKWANVLVHYSLEVKPGQCVAIEAMPVAEPLIRALHAEIVKAGGYPELIVTFPGLREQYLKLASDDQLDAASPMRRMVLEEFDARIAILSDENSRELSHVDPVRQARLQKAWRPAFERFLQRSGAGQVNWVVTLFPTHGAAQDADMSLDDLMDLVTRSSFLDSPDPVQAWRERSARQQRLVDYLSDKRELHVLAEDTDFRVSVQGRAFVNCDGKKNFPDGEVFTSPIEDSATGTVYFTIPAVHGGRRVQGIRLRFEHGKVVEASAESNEAYLHQMLNVDAGARFLGEFAFGTNDSITHATGQTLFDEKMGGTIHMALGASYPETGGTNTSALHWDLVCDLRHGGTVDVDGVPFMQKGQFQV